MRRGVAIALCAAIPIGFYAIGDATDAFPGVLTLEREHTGPVAAAPAAAESWERSTTVLPLQAEGRAPTGPDRALAARLDAHASLPVVHGNLAYAVVDAGTGTVLASRDADTPRAPASTLKLLTAAAALRTLGAETTLTTRTVITGSTVTLVGDGDMTLTREKLADLAEQTVARIPKAERSHVQLRVDDTALRGGENPAWGDNGRAGGWVAPTAALAVDEGMLDGQQYGPKSADPAMDAAKLFARLLAEKGVTVRGEVARGAVEADGPGGSVESAPLGEIVRHTLQISDNTTAELLGHLVARAEGRATTPQEAAAAVAEQIRRLAAEIGVPAEDIAKLRIADCSGLSQNTRVPPGLFAAVLARVVSGKLPVLEQILYDVPVAGLTGTLVDRFAQDRTRAARGLVRGKTGYLASTASLAGVTVLPDGRTVGYAILVHGFPGADADAARAAVDTVATELVAPR